MTKDCRHNADVSTIIWTKDGQRAYPCKACGKELVFGVVKIIKESGK